MRTRTRARTRTCARAQVLHIDSSLLPTSKVIASFKAATPAKAEKASSKQLILPSSVRSNIKRWMGPTSEMQSLVAEKERLVEELQQLMEKANAPIFGVDADCRVNEWNAKAVAVTGYTKQLAMGVDFVSHFVPVNQQASVHRMLERAFAGEEASNFELTVRAKGGAQVELVSIALRIVACHRIPGARIIAYHCVSSHIIAYHCRSGARVEILLNITTRRDAEGAIVGALGIGQDVTALRAAQNDRAASQAQEEIMAFLFHDLRNALSEYPNPTLALLLTLAYKP